MQNKKFYPWLVVGMLWFVALLNYLNYFSVALVFKSDEHAKLF